MQTALANHPVPPDLPMLVQLEALQWNTVLAALSEMPYRTSAPIIQAISQQLQKQAGIAATDASLVDLGNVVGVGATGERIANGHDRVPGPTGRAETIPPE